MDDNANSRDQQEENSLTSNNMTSRAILALRYETTQLSLSIPNLHRRAVLDRLQEISMIFQQQYSYSAGRIATTSAAAIDRLKNKSQASEPSRTTSSGTLLARRIAVRKLATRFPLSPLKALHHARRLQLFGRNRNRGLNFLRFTVLGLGAPDPFAELVLHKFWTTATAAAMTQPTLLLESESSDAGTAAVGVQPLNMPRPLNPTESVEAAAAPMSIQEDPHLQDITWWKREPSLDISSLTLDSLPDNLDDFQLPAAEHTGELVSQTPVLSRPGGLVVRVHLSGARSQSSRPVSASASVSSSPRSRHPPTASPSAADHRATSTGRSIILRAHRRRSDLLELPTPPLPSSRQHHRSSSHRNRSTGSAASGQPRVVRIRIRRNSTSSAGGTASTAVTPLMATATESVPDVATSETPDPHRLSTAPTEDTASGVGIAEQSGRQVYQPPPLEDEDEEMQDQDEELSEAAPAPPVHEVLPEPEPEPQEDISPAADYLMGIMAEFRKLEGKLAGLLKEQADLRTENQELLSRPPVPDPNTLLELETLTTKYNKVKKLYFQKETQIEELVKENEALRADADEFAKEIDALKEEGTELNRDLEILAKERNTLSEELQETIKDREALIHQREIAEQERDAVIQEREDLLQERDALDKDKEDAIQDRQDALLERDEARQDRENLQNRIKDLEDEVAKLQAQAVTNGVRDKRVSGTAHNSTGSDYPQEILKLKYDKVKRLYYEQQKTISHLEDRLRMAEAAARGDQDYISHMQPDPAAVSRSNSKGKGRASHVSPERDSYRGEAGSAKSTSTDTTPQRRRSVRTTGRRGASLERERMSGGTDDDSKSTYTYTPEDAPPDLASFASYLLICNVESSGHYAAPYTIHVDALPIDEGSLTPYSVDAKLIVKMADFKMRAIQKIMADLNGRHNDTSSDQDTGQRWDPFKVAVVPLEEGAVTPGSFKVGVLSVLPYYGLEAVIEVMNKLNEREAQLKTGWKRVLANVQFLQGGHILTIIKAVEEPA
ncbi:hypothetical protein Dda_6118 [Drechslerella dactyloides]|uniref:Uncharacterized protein n=1 Tax=Drechslerella dactyloides TaxID=74499 RepID=A0AAD6IV08_DREDA|nr:hypothetical protein Dda_6118 [Drechslerella dactyloides]